MEMDVLPEGACAPIKKGPGLYEFLMEAELAQYFNSFKNNLKVTHPSQLKFATDEDLIDLGMSKPELRRMRKYYDKHFANNYLTKFKKLLTNRKQQQLLNDGFPCVGSSYSSGGGVGGEYVIGGRGSADGGGCKRVPSKHIISPANITVNKELGMGEFGVVQQGVWCNEGERIQVAIKCLVRERMQTNTIEFLKEAVIMHSIDHPHIVRLFGVVLDMGSLMLVTELAPLRSLLECLKEPSVRSSFPVMTLADFAVQICDGMQYLEAKRFIHRDLAARNILVFSKNKVKISDFGLSRALGQGKDYYQTNFNVNLKLPIAWCAPECISYLRFTTASDVWAYGVTLWEMFSYGFQPWAALTGQQILEAIDDPHFQRLEQPDCCPHEYYALMLDCWRHDPAHRPRFSEIASQRLMDCRPEQVQAKVNFVAGGGGVGIGGPGGGAQEQQIMIGYRVGDVVTVLDKLSSHRPLWKGISPTAKSGLFDPTNFISYLGPDLPSSSSTSHQLSSTHPHGGGQQQSVSSGAVSLSGLLSGGGSLLRSSIRRSSKLRSEMISGPQGEVKHTGHVGLDGAYFGDISFLSGGGGGGGVGATNGGGGAGKSEYSTSIPTQIVPPYRPTSSTDFHPHTYHHQHHHHASLHHTPDATPPLDLQICPNQQHQHNFHLHDRGGGGPGGPTTTMRQHHLHRDGGACEGFDHEYHEISDEEDGGGGGNGSPDLDLGPSLMAEMELMFSSLGGPPPPPSPADHDGSNKTNELREKLNSVSAAVTGGNSTDRVVGGVGSTLTKANVKMNKQAATVKPISAQDSKTLDTAIAIANEMSTNRPKSSSHHHHHPHYQPTQYHYQHQQQHYNSSTASSTSHHHQQQHYHSQQVTPVTPTSPGGGGGSSGGSGGGKRKFSFRFPSASSGGNSGGGGVHVGGAGQGGGVSTGDVELRGSRGVGIGFAEEAQSTSDLQSKVTQEAQLAYQSLVESPSPDLSQFGTSNPLRLLRSGNLNLIKPRMRTTTLPSSHFRSQETNISNDSLTNKNGDSFRSSLPTVQTSQPPQSPTTADGDLICRPFGSPVDENPIPLPPRDRNKPLLLSKPRHTRKHPLIIPPSSFQTSLHKFVLNNKQNDDSSSSVLPPPSPTANNEPLYSNQFTIHQHTTTTGGNDDNVDDHHHFEARIDRELAALDHVPNVPRAPDLAPTDDDVIVPPQYGGGDSNELGVVKDDDRDADGTDDDGSRLRRHHVSCEDLLEFADTRPSSRERGTDSDEVRIMGKVLGTDYNAAQCVETLEFTDWDVIRAIKLCRLRKLVSGAEIAACNVALETTGWDVTKAAQFILQHDAEVQV